MPPFCGYGKQMPDRDCTAAAGNTPHALTGTPAKSVQPRLSFVPTSGKRDMPLKRWIAVGACLSACCHAGEPRTGPQVNAALQQPVCADAQLFTETAATVAARLGLVPTSRGEARTIWGTTGDFVLCGLPVAEVRLFETRDGRVRALEFNLLNKGDYFSPANVRRLAARAYSDPERAAREARRPSSRFERQMRNAFRKRFEATHETLGRTLTRLFGDPERQRFKRAERRRIWRWDWDNAAFLLDAEEDEFITLRILAATEADAGGRSERINDADIKDRIRENVRHGANGDIWIANIPMIDQGDKGYCAVASAERLLRYFAVPVDSHELAEMAKTDKFGGTALPALTRAVSAIASRNRRTCKRLGSTPSVTAVTRYIEKGIPLLWAVYISAELEQIAVQRQARRQTASAAQWKRVLAEQRRATARMRPNRNDAHLRLIVGVNRETDEIAYSDSWGHEGPLGITAREAKIIILGAPLSAIVPEALHDPPNQRLLKLQAGRPRRAAKTPPAIRSQRSQTYPPPSPGAPWSRGAP